MNRIDEIQEVQDQVETLLEQADIDIHGVEVYDIEPLENVEGVEECAIAKIYFTRDKDDKPNIFVF